LPILVNASTQLSTTLAGARISVGITGTVRSRSRSPRMVVMVLPVPGSSKISAWPRSAIIRAPSTWYDRGVSPSGSSTVNSPLPERSRSVYWLAIHCCRRGIGCQYGPSACASCTTAGHVAGISSALPSALEIRGVRCLMWCAIVLIAYGCPLASSTMCVSSAVRSPTSTPSLYADIGLPFGQLRSSRSGTGTGTVPDDHTLTCQTGRSGASRGYAPDRRSSGGLTSQLCQQRRLLRGQPRSRIVRGVARRGGLLLGGRCRVRGRRGLRLRPRRTLVGHREHILRNRDPGELSLFDLRDRNDPACPGCRPDGGWAAALPAGAPSCGAAGARSGVGADFASAPGGRWSAPENTFCGIAIPGSCRFSMSVIEMTAPASGAVPAGTPAWAIAAIRASRPWPRHHQEAVPSGNSGDGSFIRSGMTITSLGRPSR